MNSYHWMCICAFEQPCSQAPLQIFSYILYRKLGRSLVTRLYLKSWLGQFRGVLLPSQDCDRCATEAFQYHLYSTYIYIYIYMWGLVVVWLVQCQSTTVAARCYGLRFQVLDYCYKEDSMWIKYQLRIFSIATADCILCNGIGTWKIFFRIKQLMLMNPKGLARCHQTLTLWVGSGHNISHHMKIFHSCMGRSWERGYLLSYRQLALCDQVRINTDYTG